MRAPFIVTYKANPLQQCISDQLKENQFWVKRINYNTISICDIIIYINKKKMLSTTKQKRKKETLLKVRVTNWLMALMMSDAILIQTAIDIHVFQYMISNRLSQTYLNMLMSNNWTRIYQTGRIR